MCPKDYAMYTDAVDTQHAPGGAVKSVQLLTHRLSELLFSLGMLAKHGSTFLGVGQTTITLAPMATRS